MLSIGLVLAACTLIALSGFPALLMPKRGGVGQVLASVLLVAGGALGLLGACLSLRGAAPQSININWFLPFGAFAVEIDPISAFFLCLVFLVPALSSIYGLGYWRHSEHGAGAVRLGVFYGLLAASMALIVIARDSILFLLAWEVMALSAYFAAGAEADKPEFGAPAGSISSLPISAPSASSRCSPSGADPRAPSRSRRR